MLLMVLLVAVGCAPEPRAASAELHGARDVNGCGWPSVVLITHAAGTCTGTLVHPQVVLFAGHCSSEVRSIGFGERGADVVVTPARCAVHPDFRTTGFGTFNDVAYCVLGAPSDVPFVPIATACEVAALGDGDAAQMVGFGRSDGAAGAGQKRIGDGVLGPVTFPFSAFSITASPSFGCSGDSGGPVFVTLPSGGVRQIGVMSQGDLGCATGTSTGAQAVHAYAVWLETETGLDVTPCHDALTGAWDAGPDCGPVPNPTENEGTWPSCASRRGVIDEPPMCVPDVPDGGGTLDASWDAGDVLDASWDAGNVLDAPSAMGGEDAPSDAGEVDDAAAPESRDAEDTDGGAREPGSSPGCACRAGSARAHGNPAWWLALLGLGWLRGRTGRCRGPIRRCGGRGSALAERG